VNVPNKDQFARELGQAWANAEPVPAPSLTDPSLTPEDAYDIQELIVADRMRDGSSRAGWKLGLTSADPPATPIVGALLSDMILSSGVDLALETMVAPLVEAELVVRIGTTIDAPQTADELRRGPHEIGPGIEVIDYRTVDSAGVVDWIADNSTVAYGVVGEYVPVTAIDPSEVEARLFEEDTFLASGAGNKVMGDPLAAVAWLSNHLSARGHILEQGQVVLTGSLTGHHDVPPDRASRFHADFGPLGTVCVRFAATGIK
jgi:2-keto-4-pentenoate hydratase